MAIAEYPILPNASEIALAVTSSLSIVNSFMGVVVSTFQLSSPTNSSRVYVTFAMQQPQLIFVLNTLFYNFSSLLTAKMPLSRTCFVTLFGKIFVVKKSFLLSYELLFANYLH